jgi:hypothetical protein
MDNKQKGNLAVASAINYLLLSAGDNCSPAEESVGENFPNSVKPSGDGNAEPVPSWDGVET